MKVPPQTQGMQFVESDKTGAVKQKKQKNDNRHGFHEVRARNHSTYFYSSFSGILVRPPV